MKFLRDDIDSKVGYSKMSIPSVKGFKVVESVEGYCFDVAFEPVSTIKMAQKTCNWNGDEEILMC